MVGRSALVAGAMMAGLIVPAAAQELERTMPTRAFSRFELDSETVTGFWAEAGALFERTERETTVAKVRGDLDVDTITSFARVAYGDKKWEADVVIPYHLLDESFSPRTGATSELQDDGIGDIQLTGKYIPLRGHLMDLGGGVRMSLPSGQEQGIGLGDVGGMPGGEDRGFGTGEFGAMPFLTGALHITVAEVRGHIGGLFFTGDNNKGLASDRLVYGFGVYVPMGKYISIRNEFSSAEFYDEPQNPKLSTYMPGVDIRVPIGDLDLLIRPTGLIGVSDLSPDWGVGGSLVITSPTTGPPSGAGGVGGVIVE